MLPLVKEIAAWYKALPSEKKYLLAYVRSTQELWQGANYWYYPGGNALAKDKNTSNDPKLGPSGGMQLGYAAVCSAGAECSGNITVAEIDKVRNKRTPSFFVAVSSSQFRCGKRRFESRYHESLRTNETKLKCKTALCFAHTDDQ